MDFRDISIITQVAAKEASQVAAACSTDNPVDVVLTNWKTAFDVIADELLAAIERRGAENAEKLVAQGFPASGPSAPAAYDGTVRVKGAQHGDLPEWLKEAAAKAGVGEVWDNRDSIAGTRKPHFKQVLPQGSTQNAIGFWPPR